MLVSFMDNSLPGSFAPASGDSAAPFYDPRTEVYRPEQLQGYRGFGADGDLSLENIEVPSLTEAEVESIRNSLIDRFYSLARDIRAGITPAEQIAGNGATLEQVAGSLESTMDVIAKWGDRGLELAHGKYTPFDSQLRAENAWRSAGAAFESQIAAAPGYAHDARLTTVLKQTADQTMRDVKQLVDDLPKSVFGAVPWWVWAGGAALVAWKLGAFSGSRSSLSAYQKRGMRHVRLVEARAARRWSR